MMCETYGIYPDVKQPIAEMHDGYGDITVSDANSTIDLNRKYDVVDLKRLLTALLNQLKDSEIDPYSALYGTQETYRDLEALHALAFSALYGYRSEHPDIKKSLAERAIAYFEKGGARIVPKIRHHPTFNVVVNVENRADPSKYIVVPFVLQRQPDSDRPKTFNVYARKQIANNVAECLELAQLYLTMNSIGARNLIVDKPIDVFVHKPVFDDTLLYMSNSEKLNHVINKKIAALIVTIDSTPVEKLLLILFYAVAAISFVSFAIYIVASIVKAA